MIRMTYAISHRPSTSAIRSPTRRSVPPCVSSPTPNLLEMSEDDDGRYVRFLEVNGKVDLTQNERFAEGEAERESFKQFSNSCSRQRRRAADDHQSPIYPSNVRTCG